MSEESTLDTIASRLTPELRTLVNTIDIDRLSRVPPSRLASRALPHIGSIELVSSQSFESSYQALYIEAFPDVRERERPDLIVTRLAQQAAGTRHGLAIYRIVGLRDIDGAVIGAVQFSVLPVRAASDDTEDRNGAKDLFAVPYLQYIYVRVENRRQDMSEILHTMVLTVATADSSTIGANRGVPLTLFEAEPPSHAVDRTAKEVVRARLRIHALSGGIALVLRDASAPTGYSSAHVQPGLEDGDEPLSLLWVVRPSPAIEAGGVLGVNATLLGVNLIAAYYQSLRDEGFPELNIRLAEQLVAERSRGHSYGLLSLKRISEQHLEYK